MNNKETNLTDINKLFVNYCENNKLPDTKLLYRKNPNIKFSYANCSVFVNSCVNGHLNVVRWLYSIKSGVFDRLCDFIQLFNTVTTK